MSLADLYRDDTPLDEGSELGESEDEFVPGGTGDDGSGGSGSGSGSDSDSERDRAEEDEDSGDSENNGAEASEQQKRKIDDIWQEMNAPTGQRAAKQARVEDKEGEEAEGKSQEAKKSSPEPKERAQETEKDQEADGRRRRGPKRRASKFSKMAEMVEQRRGRRENTLDRARNEWAGFVASEGIRDDLDKANKDGYVERQEFLHRVDQRTFDRARGR
ncbi:hypothetical protein LPJ56_007048, partial [Coemansia sp. RSA 2599]